MEFKTPRGQTVWHLIYKNADELQYVVTSDLNQERWYLYEVSGDKLLKIESGKSPMFKTLENRRKAIAKAK